MTPYDWLLVGLVALLPVLCLLLLFNGGRDSTVSSVRSISSRFSSPWQRGMQVRDAPHREATVMI